ncbi:MAG TPA: hypothetical protein VK137_07995 [Planctomycetaceae bacterium]|nr:hypothetical protein [Planctomycetaceae bacterium]
MVKLNNVVAAAIVFVAAGAMASNFRVADQVYVPAAGHIGGSSGTFISDVFISNLSTDPVSVSVIYASTAAGTQATFNNIIQLTAGERREIVDFFPSVLGLQTGFGQLIFNGCKQGGNCTVGTCPGGDPTAGTCPDFRNISVESRIYSIPPGTTLAQNPPTTGQLFSGLPWYNFVTSDASGVGLDKVFITGLRNNAGYRGNVGLVNASQFSTTTLVVKLFNGLTGAQIGSTFQTTLAPLGHTQQNLGVIFPAFTGTTATNAYLTVEQTNTISVTPPDPGCPTGCPAFFAYGSVLDNQSGDATTLEPQYLQPLSGPAITCIYNPTTNCKTAVSIHRAVKH